MLKGLEKFIRREENIWSNFELESSKAYILYMGNHNFSFFPDSLNNILGQRYKKPVETIKVTNKIGPLNENVIAYHPKLDEMMDDKEVYKWFWFEKEHTENIVKSNYFQDISNKIIKNQGELFLDLFTNNGFPNESINHRIRLLAPPQELVEELYNKFDMYAFLEREGFPMPEGYRVKGKQQVIDLSNQKFNNEVYVTKATSSSGEGCRIFENRDDLEKDSFLREDEEYFVKRRLEIICSPSASGIVSEDDVCILPSFHQRMKGTSVMGANFPPRNLSSKLEKEISDMNLELGHSLRKKGFRFFYNVDFMVTPDEDIYVAEVNPRKFQSLGEFFSAYEPIRRKSDHSLSEIGFWSLWEKNLPKKDFSRDFKDVSWLKETLKSQGEDVIEGDVGNYSRGIREAFTKGKNSFCNFLGSGTKYYAEGSYPIGDLILFSENGSFNVDYHRMIVESKLGIKNE